MDTTADFTAGIDAYVEHGFVDLDEVRLHYVEAGDPDAYATDLTKAEASKRIDALQEATGRGV